MVRKEKYITDKATLEKIIAKATICRLSMVDGEKPYMIPLNFGYTDGSFYFHTGLRGKKLGILQKNPNVCIEIDVDHQMVEGETACKWGMKFRSVLAFGVAMVLMADEEKRSALQTIMNQYSTENWNFPDEKLAITQLIRVDVDSMTGLVFGYEN